MNVTNRRGNVGAILFRTSTSDQLEISPETQVKESLALAEQMGYYIPSDYIIGCDWASETFWDSPTMERLKELILLPFPCCIIPVTAKHSHGLPHPRLHIPSQH